MVQVTASNSLFLFKEQVLKTHNNFKCLCICETDTMFMMLNTVLKETTRILVSHIQHSYRSEYQVSEEIQVKKILLRKKL